MENRVQFQLGCWCGDQSLKEAFPVLHEIVTDQEASVESLLAWHQREEMTSWDVRFY